MGQIADTLRAALARFDTARYELRTPGVDDTAWTWAGEGARLLGVEIPQVEALEGQPPPPPPPPPSPPTVQLQGFGVTYHYPGADHDPAKDIYLGPDPDSGEWGQHWGLDVLAPVTGLVSIYQFPTPLLPRVGAPHLATDDYLRNHAALFAGALRPGSCYYAGQLGTQTMFFALLSFDTPQRLRNSRLCKGIWIGHCRSDAAVGRVNAGDRFCTTWNSGINFEADGIVARASHAHTCGTISGALSMNGEVDGLLIAELLGWQVRDAGIGPGPNEYLAGQYRAGKPVSAWQNRPLPPPPPGL